MLHRSCCIITVFLILSVNCHGNSTNAFLNFIPQVTIVLFEMLNTKSTSDSRMKTWVYSIFVTIDTFSFIGTLHFAFLLTVNRFAAVNSPNFNAFFESVKFYFLIASVWLSVLVLSLAEFYFCTKTFVTSNLRWSVNCTKRTCESGENFLKIRYVWTLALPITMFAIYISIFYNIRRKLRNIADQCSTSSNIFITQFVFIYDRHSSQTF
ncbi:7 transmembrane receptor (rhodopsin family) protein [Acanthocheilonema viteae]